MTDTTSITGMGAGELMGDLGGFEEIAIEKHFDGLVPMRDFKTTPFKVLRALIFIWKRREGAADQVAYKAAMSVPARDLADHFEDEDEDDLDEDTPAGKDE